jgi:multiple sugar transport system substrate-binding protein
MADSTERHTASPEEVNGTRTTRRELLKRTGVGAAAIAAYGVGAGGAFARRSVPGATKYAGRELAGTLRIIQWSHFVPAYDDWFDDIYVKRWGEANDTEVVVDHINQADIPARAAAEVAAQSGHDLFFFLSPPAAYEDQVISHNEIVQEVTKRRGKMKDLAHKATYNPRTKKYFAFSDNYVPDPMHYRTDLWGEAGLKPDTWENVLKAAPKLRSLGNPIGLGMSNEIDSNMALMALMMCFGSFIQNEEQRIVLNSKATVEALTFARELYRQGMSNEIFAWTAASNNQAFVAGRLSAAMNAISIARTLEGTNPDVASKTALVPIPTGPNGRVGLEHVMGAYVIWKFAQNKSAAAKFLADLEIKYIGAFENSKFYNFPSWPKSVPNIQKRLERDPVAKPAGKYSVLGTIAEKHTNNPGFPGFTNAGIDEIFNKFMIPQMFAEVAQGKRTPADAARVYDRSFKKIFARWRARGKV